jgi:hypothetical protein
MDPLKQHSMSRRRGSSDPSSTAWRMRQIAGPDLALRYLQGRDASAPAPPAPAPVPAAAPAAEAPPALPAMPSDPMRSLFEQLRGEMDKALPSLSPHEQNQAAGLFGRIAPMFGKPFGTRGLQDILNDAGSLRRLILQGEHLARYAGLPAPDAGEDTGRTGRVLAALTELKLTLLRQGLHPNGGSASLATATDLYTRLGHLTHRWQQAPGDAAAWALIERDEARPLAVEVFDFLRAGHAYAATPVWPGAVPPVDAGTLFFSGSEAGLQVLARAAQRFGLRVDPQSPPGADFAPQRWRSLRRSALAVFDLGGAAPQVYYELGMALASGAQILLLAPQGEVIPFDVAQTVTRYADMQALAGLLPEAIDGACWQVQSNAPRSVDGFDALTMREIIAIEASLRDGAQVLCGRWPWQAESETARWFAVMPFRAGPDARWAQMARRLRKSLPGLEQVRGDRAAGAEIIASIWEELCRATRVSADLSGVNPNVCLEIGMAHTLGRPTLLIGEAGTASRLSAELPGLAKWRCHEYGSGLSRTFNTAVDRFFAAA